VQSLHKGLLFAGLFHGREMDRPVVHNSLPKSTGGDRASTKEIIDQPSKVMRAERAMGKRPTGNGLVKSTSR
jgi:hypothetical protein